MKKFSTVLFAVSILGMSACSKGEGVRAHPPFPISEPTPAPSPISTPTPSPIPSPTSAPSPSPTVSPVPNPSPIACSPAALREFAHYGSVAIEKGTYRGMDISHGLLARDATLDGVELGYGLHREVGRFDVIGENVSLAWTDVVSGGVAYADQLKIRDQVDTYSVIRKARPVDFDAMKERLIELQIKLVELPENGTVTTSCTASGSDCAVTLVGRNPTVNRFTLTKEHIRKRGKLVIQVPKRATAVVVLNEQHIEFDDMELDVPNETIWTMAKRGGKFVVDFMTLRGTVFLLDSTFEMDQALLMGRVIAKEFTSKVCHDDRACSTIETGEMPENVCL